MEKALGAIHPTTRRRLPIYLELGLQGDTVTLAFSFPHELRAAIERQLYAQ